MSDTSMPSSLCRTFASTLGGTAEVVNGVCTVTRIRSNLKPLIQGRKTNSALALAALFSFESFDSRGNALNLGETVILQEEINPFISELRNRGIEVTAVHNHWLFDNPRLMYIHFKSVEPPLTFANKVAAAFKVLTSRTVGPNTTSGSRGSNGSKGSKGSMDRMDQMVQEDRMVHKGHKGYKVLHNASMDISVRVRRKNQTLNQRNPVPVRPLKDLNVRNK